MVQDIFKARADSFGETMIGGSGTVSFKLPEYQRPYDWDKGNVQRLLQDCLNGLIGVASQSSGHHYTFLGTIILTSDESKETTFDGDSLSIVDGQQRLTTLLLLSCALFVAIRNHRDDIELVSDVKVREWLKQEVDEQSIRLFGCTTGQRQSLSPTPSTPFPRMVRDNDIRGHRLGQSQYVSAIADFLNQFGQYCTDQSSEFDPAVDSTEIHLLGMFQHLGERIEQHVYLGKRSPDDDDDDFDPPVLSRSEFARRGCRDLFVKLGNVGAQPDVDRVASNIASSAEPEGLIRLLLFSSYVIRSVVLTVVEAPSEDVAFDIFDALNTTGEPLTALETLKPHVVRFEREHGDGYPGSDSERWWRILEENVIEPYDTPDRRQRETKELVTGFALYYVGEKIGADLKKQRDTLRNYFVGAGIRSHEVAREVVCSLSLLAQFRRQYWDKDAIDGIVGGQFSWEDYDTLKLCLRFIADTNTSTVIPILARYLIEFGEMDSEQHFLDAVKAVSAFLALRRGMTGGTEGIDSDFRRIMSPGTAQDGNPLCLGPSMTNKILGIHELKSGLRALLAAPKFRMTDKSTWMTRSRDIPLANRASRVVCKFLFLAASHNARPDPNRPGLLTREGIISSDELNFLTHIVWIGQKYGTLEHVSPASENSAGWDPTIYERVTTRHTIGNLVLLPERENQSIGNASWNKKKLFYRALVAKTEEEREEAIRLARQQGLRFGNKTLSLIRGQNRLHLFDPIAGVEDWTAELVGERTENLLSLAWDQITPWIFD